MCQSELRLKEDLAARATIPAPVLEVWRLLADEKDVWEGLALENRERLLPLEHSDLNDIESSVAQKRIRQVTHSKFCAMCTECLVLDGIGDGYKGLESGWFHSMQVQGQRLCSAFPQILATAIARTRTLSRAHAHAHAHTLCTKCSVECVA